MQVQVHIHLYSKIQIFTDSTPFSKDCIRVREEAPCFVRQFANCFSESTQSTLLIWPDSISSLILLNSILSLFSITCFVDRTASNSDLQSVIQDIVNSFESNVPVMSSLYKDDKNMVISMPSAMAKVSAAMVLLATLLIFLEFQQIGENVPLSLINRTM